MQKMKNINFRKKSPGNFINILLLIIFVATDNFYLFYFGKEAAYKQTEAYLD